MRVLTITPDFPPSVGGIQSLLGSLVAGLSAHDHLVVTRGPGPAAPGVRRTRGQARPALAELQAVALMAGVRFRPDVVLSGHVVATPAALALRRACGVPVVTYAHADEIPHLSALSTLAMRRSRRIIAVSRYAAGLCRAAGADDSRLRVIHPGVDQRPLPPASPAPRPPTVVTVARLADRYKGHDVALDALALVRRVVGDVRWVIVGDGPLRAELEARSRALGLASAVEFAGALSDDARDSALVDADIFLMPSRLPDSGAGGEGFGIAYLEAALAGLPVVAGRVAGALDAVADGTTGILVDPSSPRAIADALLELLLDPARRDALGTAGCERGRGFTWDRMAGEVDRVLREAVNGGGGVRARP